MTLEQYYKTDHWKKTSSKLIKENNTCQICGNDHYYIPKRGGKKRLLRRFCCHHKNYNHLFNEKKEDLMVICFSCHETGHSLEALAERDDRYKKILNLWKETSGWESEKRKRSDELLK